MFGLFLDEGLFWEESLPEDPGWRTLFYNACRFGICGLAAGSVVAVVTDDPLLAWWVLGFVFGVLFALARWVDAFSLRL